MHSSPRRPAHGGVSSCNGNNAQRISTSQALGRAACSRPTPLRAPGVRPRSVSRCRDVPAVRHIGRQHFQYSGRELPPERIVSHEVIHFFGMRCRVPVVTHWAGTVIAVRRTSLLASGQVHVIGWLIGTAEVWIALRFMGFPVTVNEALVIESLLQAVRGAAFAIPGAFGAQEAGLILLCGLFEIPPDQAFALSLIKRAADLVVGLPGLVSLQVLEGGRLKALYSHAREGRARNRP